MPPEVSQWLSRCRRDPAALTPVKALFADFNASIRDKGKWSRTNFVMELARAGFSVAEYASCDSVAGLCPPSGGWQATDGKLSFVA